MTNLISGKEALIALGSGKEVEYKSIDGWGDASLIHAFEFLDNNYEFRLKPRTITINGIEVPAPFEPKEGEKAYRLAPAIPCGYTEFYFNEHENEHKFGAWRTEEEIKQVVEALRQVFGRSDDAVNAVRGGK